VRQRERMTMADLAGIAGVSKITISRALADSPLVRESVREEIKALARQHGYRLNVAARDLRRQRRQTIAVVIEMTPSDERPMSEPYPLALLAGIAQELAQSDYSMLVALHGRLSESEIADSDGVILLGQGAHEDGVHRFDRLGIPLAVWGAPHGEQDYVVVGSDNLLGGRIAGDYLTSQGKKRLVFLGDTDHAENADRLQGFKEAIGRKGASLTSHLPCDFTIAAGRDATAKLLQDKVAFDGIFACNDLVAVGAINALSAAGRKVPSEVSVIGYDDAPVAAAYIPPVTTIRQNWISGGRSLAANVLKMVQGEPAKSEALPTTLIVRAT
jgi:DNA-binding LacI/PurR family transcriptional regulator